MFAELGLEVVQSDAHGTKKAQRICATQCPIMYECGAYAVVNGEQEGIWGGLGSDGILKNLRARHAEGLPWRTMLRAHQSSVKADFDPNHTHEWPWQESRKCERCGDTISAGRFPPDRNPDGATCGKVATAVKGCPCFRCKIVNNQRLLKQRSPGIN